jgi:hypothetical protein
MIATNVALQLMPIENRSAKSNRPTIFNFGRPDGIQYNEEKQKLQIKPE